MLDSIIPKMLPFVFTLGIYNLVQKKVNTNVLLIGIVMVSNGVAKKLFGGE